MTALLPLFFAAAVRAAAPPAPRFAKIVIVIFENADFKDAVKQPFFASLAERGALLTDYHAVGHPSLPNYIALVSGGTQGVKDDGVHDLDARSVVDLLEAKGKSWKLYAEGYPGGCFLRPRSRRYARKHVPLLSFTNVQKDAERCARVVDARDFFVDLSSGALPDYSLFVPDLRDDGHDTGVAYADTWFKTNFGPVLKKWPARVLLVATFDEDSNSGGTNQIYTALYGGMVKTGARVDERYSHYSLLRTVEDEWKLGDLGGDDAQAEPIAGVWK